MNDRCLISRRRLLSSVSVLCAGGVMGAGAAPAVLTPAVHTKVIPASGETLPVIGMGTWITFNVGNDPQARAQRTQVLQTFFQAGGGMVDSSPMYGHAEEVMGHCLGRLGPQPGLFTATKVWSTLGSRGNDQIADSHRLWGVERFDLLQVHNLVAWREHLKTLFAMKERDELRYVGVTTSHGRRHGDLEKLLKSQPLDFVQLTYNVLDREVEQRLLPLARERGVAVIVNRPFQGGALFERFGHRPLPAWAADIGCDNWAQFFLKFTVSHPAVTCAIPATSQVPHMVENMGALRGPLPDAAMRVRMVNYLQSL
ncbi:aldo/keto reductase [Exilibacterium tricleocarpae]|uniref:Aldo/keto reductase n=1 Tax=Exilibacterium tricleocarpae TaxID=2591008 RepID=A0A545T633_9GAMM|nr:aldo/keto reductase [Exilibacterium tricleocarpae]TQV72697.1 aldo/keto reductase [Exilibacterium tricleocarpae]